MTDPHVISVVGRLTLNTALAALSQARSVQRSVEGVILDLSRVTWIDLEAIAAIVAALPTIATQHQSAALQVPTSNPDAASRASPAQFLSDVELASAVDALSNLTTRKLSVLGKLPPRSGVRARSEGGPIALQIVSEACFAHDGLWLDEEPRLTGKFAETLAVALMTSGVAFSSSHFDALRAWVREAGWNAVVHSDAKEGYGWAVLGVQFRKSLTPRALDFVLVDSGTGIPRTLSTTFDRFRQTLLTEGRTEELKRWDGQRREEALLRFALTDHGTRRLSTPASARRGLGKMLDVISSGGVLRLTSGDATVMAAGGSGAQPAAPETSYSDAWPGTLVAGRILEPSRPPVGAEASTALAGKWLDEVAVVQLSAPDGTAQIDDSLRLVQELVGAQASSGDRLLVRTVLIDCGFSSEVHEQDLRRVIEALVGVPAVRCAIVNCPLEPHLLSELAMTVASDARNTVVPVLLLRKRGEAYALGLHAPQGARRARFTEYFGAAVDADNASSPLADSGLVRVTMSPASLHLCDFRANCAIIEAGFLSGQEVLGFYRGRFRLLDGGIATRYLGIHDLTMTPSLRERLAHSIVLRLPSPLPPPAGVLVLGFASSSHRIVEAVASTLGVRAALLHPYDVPTLDELKESLAGATSVVVITDVVSSGSLIVAISDALRRLGVAVISSVAAVRSIAPGARLPDGIQWTAEFDRAPETDRVLIAVEERDIDPVTFVPRTATDEGRWKRDIDDAITLLESTGAVTFGHLRVTERHSSAVVDVAQLLSAETAAFGHMLQERYAALRRNRPEYSSFSPAAVVTPAVGTRMETIAGGDAGDVLRHSYRRATKELTSLVKRLVERGDDFPEIIAARQYDRAGRPEIAFSPRDAAALRDRDVIVVDDGLATGGTMSQLLRALVEAGAGRIWAVALCSRATIRETNFWSAVTELSASSRRVPVAISLCLVLPIPFHEAKSCPVCVRRRAIEDLAKVSDAVGLVAANVLRESSLESWERCDGRWTARYTRMRLRAHAYATLAESMRWARDAFEDSLTKASVIAASGGHAEPDEVEELDAVLSLLIEEPELISRARSRRTFEPLIASLARQVVTTTAFPLSLRMRGLVVLRSMAGDTFARLVSESLVRDTHGSPLLLERLAFQVYSLAERHSNSDSLLRGASLLLERLDAALAADASAPELIRGFQIAYATTLLPFEIPEWDGDVLSLIKYVRESVASLSIRGQNDHRLPTMLTDLHSGERGRDVPAHIYRKVAPDVMSLRTEMQQEVLPIVARLSKHFRACPDSLPVDSDFGIESYCASIGSARRGQLPQDLVVLSSYCVAGAKDVPELARPAIADAARRLRLGFYDASQSALLLCLRSWYGTTVGDLVSDLRAEVDRVTRLFAEMDVSVHDGGCAAQPVFCSRGLLRLVFASWADNLNKAFPAGHTGIRSVRIVAERRGSGDSLIRGVRIRLVDNGVGLPPDASPSRTTIDLRERCALFGVTVRVPMRIDIGGSEVFLEALEVES